MMSAMYENGGNTVHRLFDGHPDLSVYPFESQIGTRLVADLLTSVFPVKYRWPVFRLGATGAEHYQAIIDEEVKVRTRTPEASKFRSVPLELSDAARLEAFTVRLGDEATTGAIVMAFFRATFDAWRNRQGSAAPAAFVGYSPAIVVDAAKIVADLPRAHVLHIVRNPWSAFADTKRRAVPLALTEYMRGWVTNQQHALAYAALFPDRVHILRFEDVIANPVGVLGDFCERLKLRRSESLGTPTWNGAPLQDVPPWGVVNSRTISANEERARSLSEDERHAIEAFAGPLLDSLSYRMLAD
jgi:hypothetical protein